MLNRDPRDDLPDVGDGLTPWERVVLWWLSDLQRERRGLTALTMWRGLLA